MRLVLKILKIVGIILLILIVLVAALLFWLSTRPFVPDNYTKTVATGGELEAKIPGHGETRGEVHRGGGPGGLEKV